MYAGVELQVIMSTVKGHRDHEGAHEKHCHHELHTGYMNDSTAGIKSETLV